MSDEGLFDELLEEESDAELGRPLHRTEPHFQTLGPRSGVTWGEFFEQVRKPADSKDEPDEKSIVLETGIPLGELPSTAARIWREAELAGFVMEGYESRSHFFDKFQKSDGKTALAGDLVKAAYDARNIFIGGYVPDSALRFHASWLDGGFVGFVWDPVGKYMYANSRAKDERQTYWTVRLSTEFEAWLDEWRERMTGNSRRLEKERAEARKQAKRDEIYQDYLDHQNGEGIYEKEAA